MGLKKLPAWIKLGTIFLIFPLIGLYCISKCESFGCIICFPFVLPIALTIEKNVFWMHIINFIFYFLIGALIGWTYWVYRLARNKEISLTQKVKQAIILFGVIFSPIFLIAYTFILTFLGLFPLKNS